VQGHTLVVVSDAHLGVTPPAVEEALMAFLDAVPTLGDSLLLTGDLFDFWFAYSRVVPRRGFQVAAALATLARRMPVLMVGGNHDRWGGDFWSRDLGLRFDPYRLTFRLGRIGVAAIHGDGLEEGRRRARILHRLIHHPATSAVYRTLHPEIGFRLVEALSPHLGDQEATEARLEAAAAHQRAWATQLLAREPDLGMVIMGHTHRPELSRTADGRTYLNPGAWFVGLRYAVATEDGAELRQFNPGAPPPPAPGAPR
jgi:UDP-2,3-diacylglucosamine hydrolase